MNTDTLCLGCMCERGTAEVCSLCKYRYGTPAETPLVLPPGTTLRGDYVVGKKLGQGGFGITYIGYDFGRNHRVAIKEFFPREISTRAEDRHTVSPIGHADKVDLDYGLLKFEEEAKALAQFKNHPGIVSFLDFFRTNGTGYIVMGYVDGDTLRKYLKQKGEQISFDEALKILDPVMRALEDIHRVQILHRDISPENIYIERDGGVKLLDFGAAKQALGEHSQSMSVILRPGYAPPEQYYSRGRQGAWTDIYALGATFYRSITGRVPPESLGRLEMDDLIRPRQLNPSISARSETALLKAIAPKIENRFHSAQEFRVAITPTVIEKILPPNETTTTSRYLSKPLLLFFFLACFIALFVLNTGDPTYIVWEIFPLLVLFALMLFMFERMWKSIQDGNARLTPDKAISFSFFPLFNLYWAFQVMWGFSVDYNRYLDRHHPSKEKLPENLFMATTIFYVFTCITAPFSRNFFSFLIVVNGLLLCIVVGKTCDAINALQTPDLLPPQPAKGFSLYCVIGQFQGQHVDIGQQAIVIGRNAKLSNLVLNSDDISSTHVKIWQDTSSNGVWVEDLKSTNGTSYHEATSGNSNNWTKLTGSKLLSPGDQFRLSQGKAVFEVR